MCSKSRDYCLTIHDTDNLGELLEGLKKDLKVQYWIVGEEVCPTTNKKHLQCYFYYTNPRSFSAIKKLYKTAHIEPAKGTPQQASEYCKKEGKYHEGGILPQKQGARNDLDKIREVIEKTSSMAEVVKVATSYQSVKMAEQILKYHEKPRTEKPYVEWYYGPTGTGKSRKAYEKLGQDCYTAMSTGKWFEGYDGHKKVLIDDMRKDFMKFHELLRLLDRYPMRVEQKGASRQFVADHIIITSAYPPGLLFETREDIHQLLRRIDNIEYLG